MALLHIFTFGLHYNSPVLNILGRHNLACWIIPFVIVVATNFFYYLLYFGDKPGLLSNASKVMKARGEKIIIIIKINNNNVINRIK